MAQTCAACGATDLPDTAQVCGYCGHRLGTPPTASRRARWPIVTAGLVLVAVVGVVTALLLTSGDEPVAAPTTEGTTAPATTTTDSGTTPTAAASTTAPATTTPPTSTTAGSTEPLPSTVTSQLAGSRVLAYEDFSEGTGGFAYVTEGDSVLTPPAPLVPGQAIVVTFIPTDAPVLGVIESGAFGAADYRRFGFRLGADWHADAVVTEIFEGAEEITGYRPASLGDLSPDPFTTYTAVLAIEPDGRFLFSVADPTGAGFATERFAPDPPWDRPSWDVYLATEGGALGGIDEVWLVAFDGFAGA